MKTVTQLIRERVERNLVGVPDLSVMRNTEWSRDFEKLMRNRLLMGCMRYGEMKDKESQGYDMIGSLVARLERYRKTGNLECLVDIANLALLEFEFPSHSRAHFSAEDDGEHCF